MNLAELKLDTRFLTNTNSTSYPDTDLLRNLNVWYKQTVQWIWNASSTWEYDDKNKTDLPIGMTDLVNGQHDYSLPNSVQQIERVEVLDDKGSWHKLDPIDQSQIDVALDEFQSTDGIPQYYDKIGYSLYLYPAPSSDYVTLSSGLKLYFTREITDLSADTDEPGFTTDFHRMLSLGAGIDWAMANGDKHLELSLGDKLVIFKQNLQNFYGKRNKDTRTRIMPKRQLYL